MTRTTSPVSIFVFEGTQEAPPTAGPVAAGAGIEVRVRVGAAMSVGVTVPAGPWVLEELAAGTAVDVTARGLTHDPVARAAATPAAAITTPRKRFTVLRSPLPLPPARVPSPRPPLQPITLAGLFAPGVTHASSSSP